MPRVERKEEREHKRHDDKRRDEPLKAPKRRVINECLVVVLADLARHAEFFFFRRFLFFRFLLLVLRRFLSRQLADIAVNVLIGLHGFFKRFVRFSFFCHYASFLSVLSSPFKSAKSSASVNTGMPSVCAFVSLLPASSPATT